MRGNPDHYVPADEIRGSIPAYAGEPTAIYPGGNPAKVYPRVCGGTESLYEPEIPCGGLSPRMRGNPPDWRNSLDRDRSIPAYAGEPLGQAGPFG